MASFVCKEGTYSSSVLNMSVASEKMHDTTKAGMGEKAKRIVYVCGTV